MASINGISVKGLKKFTGHEGEPLSQGNLYLGGKKIGFWSQDSWGGPDNFRFDQPWGWKMERALNEKVTSLNADKTIHGENYKGEPYVLEYSLERLMGDYIGLLYDEDAYKKAVKAGFAGVLIASDGYHMIWWKLPESHVKLSDKELLALYDDQIKKAKASFLKEDKYTKHTVSIYRSSDDFNIGEPIKLEDIMAQIAS